MKCKIDSDNKKYANGLIVRRKFVPLKFTIHRENQFLNAEAKLPFTTNAVIGILTTSNSERKCSDDSRPSRLYYGVSTSRIENTSFLEINPGIVYLGVYPPDVKINQEVATDLWWYYAHPVTDSFPFLCADDFAERLRDPMIINVLQPGECSAEDYYLWSERFYGYVLITYNDYT